MNNYWRVLRMALQFRGRYALAVLCALIAATLWGGNLGAVFPTMKVLLYDQTLQSYLTEQAEKRQREVDELEDKLARLVTREVTEPRSAAGNGGNESATHPQVAVLRLQLQKCKLRLHWYQKLARWADRYLPSDRYRTLAAIQIALLTGLILSSLFEFINEVLVAGITEMSMLRLRNQFYRQVMRMDLAGFTQQGTSELMARFTSDMRGVAIGIEVLLGTVVREPLRALVCISLACWLNWRLTLLAIALVPVAIAIVMVIGSTMKRAARKCLESMASIYQILQESFQGIRIVKAFAMESYERLRFLKETRNYYRKSMRNARLEALTSPVISLVAVSAVLSTVMMGSYLVIKEQTHIWGVPIVERPLTADVLCLLYVFLAGVSDPVRKLSNVYARMQRASAAADRIFAFMDAKPTVVTRRGAPRLPRHGKSVEFAGVSFRYTDSRPVLQDINLHVPFGETIALVGPNGCGKSTLVSLLPRLYDATHGSVLIDGVDIREVQRRSLRQQFGVVTQETILFNDTVYNNIAYGNRRASRAQVIAAAQQAYADPFIMQLPKGYETIVGERAMKLSGGQRQRIALARAILRDPAILILDEATSALDVESESLIQQALERFTRNRTTFLITHRLASLQLADRIVVLDGGRIEAHGTHEDLMRGCALYARLHDIHANSINDIPATAVNLAAPVPRGALRRHPWTQLVFSFYTSTSRNTATGHPASNDSVSAAA